MADKQNKPEKKAKPEQSGQSDAEKIAKAAKASAKSKDKKSPFSRAAAWLKSFFKDFKGEAKKIVWPDAKTVLKSTGVVLLVVALVAVVVYGIDQGLSFGMQELKSLASGEEATTVSQTEETDEHDHDHDEEASEGEGESEAEASSETEEATEAEETTAQQEETSAQ